MSGSWWTWIPSAHSRNYRDVILGKRVSLPPSLPPPLKVAPSSPSSLHINALGVRARPSSHRGSPTYISRLWRCVQFDRAPTDIHLNVRFFEVIFHFLLAVFLSSSSCLRKKGMQIFVPCASQNSFIAIFKESYFLSCIFLFLNNDYHDVHGESCLLTSIIFAWIICTFNRFNFFPEGY